LAGGTTRSSQADATGLECDKLSRNAVEVHFAGMVEKLAADVGPLAGKTIVSTHIDSWESGSGNWTAGFATGSAAAATIYCYRPRSPG
jgi:hypothetical protein